MGGTALQQGVDQINFTQSFVGAARTPTSERVKQLAQQAAKATYVPKTKRVPTAERTTLLGISARTMS